MFSHIMAPVDLTATDGLERALQTTAELAKLYDAKVTIVSATNATPSEVAHSPEEFAQKLAAFAHARSDALGIPVESHAITVHDRRADLDEALVDAAEGIGADLIVMASHDPKFVDHFWSSNGGAVARNSKASVMLVRG